MRSFLSLNKCLLPVIETISCRCVRFCFVGFVWCVVALLAWCGWMVGVWIVVDVWGAWIAVDVWGAWIAVDAADAWSGWWI